MWDAVLNGKTIINMKLNKLIITSFLLFFLGTSNYFGQKTITELSSNLAKGSYSIMEVRLNMEDEFRTLEGRDSKGLARISLFTGKNQNEEVLTKGFEGFNSVVTLMNEMKDNGWKVVDTYPIKGNSLLITHYVFEKVSK